MDIYNWTSEWALSLGFKLWREPETGSTSTVAKNDTEAATQPVLTESPISRPTLYLTAKQTHGRGRGDHVWTMPAGSSLLSSWSFAVARVPQPIFSPLAGLALYEAARSTWPAIAFNLKAPNDLYIDSRKTAGLLIETVDRGVTSHTVVGVGLNVAASPPGLSTATCISEHLARAITQSEWNAFLEAWSTKLAAALRRGLEESLTEDDRERLREALNRHPLLREPILAIDEGGQLVSASRTIYWHEL